MEIQAEIRYKDSGNTNSYIYVPRKETGALSEILREGKSCILNGPNHIGKDQLFDDVVTALNLERLNDEITENEKSKRRFRKSGIRNRLLDSVKNLYYVMDTAQRVDYTKGIGIIHILKSAYKEENGPKCNTTLIINQVDVILKDLLELHGKEMQRSFLADIKSLMSPEEYPNVNVLLISRYRITKQFLDICKRYEDEITCISLGGFNREEKKVFFEQLETEEALRNIKKEYLEEIRCIFEKYAGAHPYLLNSVRDILLDMVSNQMEVSAENLEKQIVLQLQQREDKHLGGVYFSLDEKLLGKEQYEIQGKKISGRRLYIQAFSEKSGYDKEKLKAWRELLYDNGYALEEDGEYKALTPYLVEYLDKWRRKELKRLMAKCDKVELALRKLLTDRLKELNGSVAEAEIYLEELLRKVAKKSAGYMSFTKMEFELNETQPDEDELLALVTLSFDDCLEIMKEIWEFPHFPNFPVFGEYVSLLEGLDHKLFEPLLWGELLQRIQQLLQKEEKLTLDEAGRLKNECDELFNNLKVWINNLKEGKDECFDLSNKLCKFVSGLKKEIRNEKDALLSDELIQKIRKLSDMTRCVEEYSKDRDVTEAAEKLLRKLEGEEFASFLERKEKREMETFIITFEAECNEIEKLLFPNIIVSEFGSETGYKEQEGKAKSALSKINDLLKNSNFDEDKEIEYAKAIKEIIDFYTKICRLQRSIKEKGNGRRLSLTRVRNVSAHRHDLEVLNVRRYTGILKECDMLLKDIKSGKALSRPKIRNNCKLFQIKPEALLTDSDQVEGEFIYSDKNMEAKYPKITGWIEKSALQGKTELSVNSLEWVWNTSRNAFQVEIVDEKAKPEDETVDKEEYTLSNIREEMSGNQKGRGEGILNNNPVLEATISAKISKLYKNITKQTVLPDTLTGLVYQKNKVGDKLNRSFIPWEVYNYYLELYNQIKHLKCFFDNGVKPKKNTIDATQSNQQPGNDSASVTTPVIAPVSQNDSYEKDQRVTFVCESVGKHKNKTAWIGKIDGKIGAKAVGEENLLSVDKPEGKCFAAQITKVAGKDGVVTFAEIKVLEELMSVETSDETVKADKDVSEEVTEEITIDKELIPLSKIQFTVTDLEMLKTEFWGTSSEAKIVVKKYDFKKNKGMKAYFKLLSSLSEKKITDEVFLARMQEKGYRSFINSPRMDENIQLNRFVMQRYYNYLRDSRLFLPELKSLEQVYTDMEGTRINSLSAEEFEQKMQAVNKRDELNTLERFLERFRITREKTEYTLLTKNKNNVSIDWNAWEAFCKYLEQLPEEQ